MTADLTFARTRIQPPRLRADLIGRPDLDAGLRAALAEQRLTLVVAPAGWGKTSALARQVASLPAGTALAWLSADSSDDVPRALAGLAAALAPFDLPWRVAPSALVTLLQSERGLRAAADEIVNALADSDVRRGLLVIDDVHRWTEPRLFELVAAVVEHLPPTWGMVVSSRTEPPLPIARWRARGELAEFRQSALRFATADIRNLLHSRGLATDGAEDLERRTQGWAVGLRLMVSIGRTAGPGASRSQRDVFDYLAEEVLAEMTPDLRLFLLRCSVLPELAPGRCAHVSGMPNARALFEQMEREGLFVTPLDESGETLRLHDLFRDFLQERLQRDLPNEMPALLRRAADHEPDLLQAVSWLVRAGAADRAADELAHRGPALLTAGRLADLQKMFALLPAPTIAAHPDVSLLRGQCAFQVFDFEELLHSMTEARTGYVAAGRDSMATLADIMVNAALMNVGRAADARLGFDALRDRVPLGPPRALVAYFLMYQADMDVRVADVVPELAQLVANLEPALDSPLWDQLTFFAVLALYPGAPALFEVHGRLAAARREFRAGPLRVAVNHLRATFAFGRGDLVRAREHLASADEDIEWLGRPGALQEENDALHGFLGGLAGDVSAARDAAERSLARLVRMPAAYRRVHSDSSLSHALRCFWVVEDAEGVRRVRADLHAAANASEWGTARWFRALADGMVALLDGDAATAERVLLPAAEANPWTNFGLGVLARVLAAEAQRRQGRLDAAAATLRELLRDPHLPQVVGCALLAGGTVVRNLAGATWGRRLDAAEIAELGRWAALLSGRAPAAAADGYSLPVGLSAREAEVLELVAKGQSNKLIARDLSLSLFTVKRHVANILAKTELASRTELAAWWVAQRGAR